MPRLFISIPIPQNIRWTLAAIAEEDLPRLPLGSRVTPSGQIHLTLLFLGEVAEKYQARIIEIARGVVGALPAPQIIIDRLSYGPGPVNPRMLWAVIKPESEQALGVISVALVKKLENEGIPFFIETGRAFRGHVTLVRFPEGGVGTLPELDDRLDFKFVAVRAELVRSTLLGGGPVYEIVDSFGFLGR